MSASPVEADELDVQYQSVFGEVSGIIDAARRSAARSVNAVMTAAYWLIGRYVVEFEQSGEERAAYGTALIERLALDLKTRFGRGFSRQNLQQMRAFYLTYPPGPICQTVSGKSSAAARRSPWIRSFPRRPSRTRSSSSSWTSRTSTPKATWTSRTSTGRSSRQPPGDLPPGTGSGFLLHGPAATPSYRRRVVPSGPVVLSPAAALSGDHRPEARQVHPC